MPTVEIESELDFALIELLQNFEAPHCESRHGDPRNKVCTHVPVARCNTCVARHVMCCQAHIIYFRTIMSDRGTLCGHCTKPAADCWSIEPLNM